MIAANPLSPLKHLRALKDRRRGHLGLHGPLDVVAIAACAGVSGADDGQTVETFGKRRRTRPGRFAALGHGIPPLDASQGLPPPRPAGLPGLLRPVGPWPGLGPHCQRRQDAARLGCRPARALEPGQRLGDRPAPDPGPGHLCVWSDGSTPLAEPL